MLSGEGLSNLETPPGLGIFKKCQVSRRGGKRGVPARDHLEWSLYGAEKDFTFLTSKLVFRVALCRPSFGGSMEPEQPIFCCFRCTHFLYRLFR